jgi:hypothetical protein
MEKDQIILLRSADRNPATSTSSANFQLSLANNLFGEYEIVYISMFNTFFSVNTGINDKIYFNDNATNWTGTLAPGLYTTSGSNSILTAIATAMNVVSSGYSASVSAVTGFITISNGSFNFSLKFATNTAASAATTLGFAKSDTSAASSAVATSVPQLSGPTSVNIFVQQCNSYNFTNYQGQYGNVLLPITVTYGALQYYKKIDFEQTILFNNRSSALNIKLLDTNGAQLSLNGTDWQMAIRKI